MDHSKQKIDRIWEAGKSELNWLRYTAVESRIGTRYHLPAIRSFRRPIEPAAHPAANDCSDLRLSGRDQGCQGWCSALFLVGDQCSTTRTSGADQAWLGADRQGVHSCLCTRLRLPVCRPQIDRHPSRNHCRGHPGHPAISVPARADQSGQKQGVNQPGNLLMPTTFRACAGVGGHPRGPGSSNSLRLPRILLTLNDQGFPLGGFGDRK